MFYLVMHSTHFIYGYMASDSERGNPILPHRLLFPISSKGSFICTIPETGLNAKRRKFIFNDALSTFYLQLYGTGRMSEGPLRQREIKSAATIS